jgi:hypothetical protein
VHQRDLNGAVVFRCDNHNLIVATCSHVACQALHAGRASVFCVLLFGLPLTCHVATLSRFPAWLEDTSTTTSAHSRWRKVKSTPIEDFYQRLIKKRE